MAFVRAPDGNGVAAQFIRIRKRATAMGADLRDCPEAAPGAA